MALMPIQHSLGVFRDTDTGAVVAERDFTPVVRRFNFGPGDTRHLIPGDARAWVLVRRVFIYELAPENKRATIELIKNCHRGYEADLATLLEDKGNVKVLQELAEIKSMLQALQTDSPGESPNKYLDYAHPGQDLVAQLADVWAPGFFYVDMLVRK